LRYQVVADIGAYHQLFTPAIPPFTGLMLSGCYKIPAIGIEVTAAFTNKMSTDAYRGAGRPEATYVIERLMDRVAQEVKIDPVKARQKNFRRRRSSRSRPQRAHLRQRQLSAGTQQSAQTCRL